MYDQVGKVVIRASYLTYDDHRHPPSRYELQVMIVSIFGITEGILYPQHDRGSFGEALE